MNKRGAFVFDPPSGLLTGELNKAGWDQPSTRRQGLRDLHRLHRYGWSFRAPRALRLETCIDFRLHDLERLRWFIGHPFFTGVLVLARARVVYERYATDFGPEQVHSIQSISKTFVHLMAARLIGARALDPTELIETYLPEVRGGYAGATVQDALDMAVRNDYSEDFYDSTASVGRLEEAHGWRLGDARSAADIRSFLARIGGAEGADPSRQLHYKSANTDIVAWICERVSGQPLRQTLLDIIEAFAPEGTVYVSTDRVGTPFVGGGVHMTLRDLARYGLLLAQGGEAEDGVAVGSRAIRDRTRAECTKGSPSLLGRGWYRNFVETDGNWIGHNGYGGQWLMVYPETGVVIACLSGLADDGGLDWAYIQRLAAMGDQVATHLARAWP